jgi:tetratricopeptide (TPR) repeat protein
LAAPIYTTQVDVTAIDVVASLKPDPANARDLQYLLARAWDAKADAIYYGQGAAPSESAHRRLVDITSAYATAHPEDMLGVRVAIEAHWALAVTLLGIGRAKDGLVEMDAASALVPVLLEFQPDDDGAKRTQRIVLAARAQALALAGRFKEGVALLRQQVDISHDLVRRSNNLAANVRSQAVTLSMLADLYDDNGFYEDSCPLYARADVIFTDLDKRGELSQLDRDCSHMMIRERQSKHCI